MAEVVLTIFMMAAFWRLFQKMGRQGWEGIVPFYNLYVLCKLLYGQGWKLLLYLIPLYNIYFYFRVNLDLARAFGQGTGFGLGLSLLNVVFYPLLAFGGFTFGDGSEAVHGDDAISRTLENLSSKMTGEETEGGTADQTSAAGRLRELDELHRAGILTDEEFAVKKAEILKKF